MSVEGGRIGKKWSHFSGLDVLNGARIISIETSGSVMV